MELFKVIKIKNIHDKKDDFRYWMKLSAEDRFKQVEDIRKEYHGEDYESKQRLQRFYRVIKQK